MASGSETMQPSQAVRYAPIVKLEGNRATEVEALSDKSVVEVPPALPQRTYPGSVRDQFAAALLSHFTSCSDPDTGKLAI